MENSRYLFREQTYRKRTKFDLHDCILQSGSQNFNDTEFLHCFCMTRQSFHLLLEEMSTGKYLSFLDTKNNNWLHINCLFFSTELEEKELLDLI
jgi:hypothetical protein